MILDPKLNLNTEEGYNPYYRAVGVGVVGASLYGMHTGLRKLPATGAGLSYNEKLYAWAHKFEEKSPFHIGKTFHLKERMSSYIHGDVSFTRSQLVGADDELNSIGKTFQRQFDSAGSTFDVLKEITEENPLRFGRRDPGSAYLNLLNKDLGIQTRFTPEGGTLAGVASRLNADLEETTFRGVKSKTLWGQFKNFRAGQKISNWSPLSKLHEQVPGVVLPYFTKLTGQTGVDAAKAFAKNAISTAELGALGGLERGQKLLYDVGLGVRAGTWNNAGGLLNKTLATRVLPIALGITALGYLDYKLGHPSNKIIDVGLKTNVLYADATDQIPGARTVTDFYEKVVPGPKYGPLALPLGGAFLGGVYHYSRVLKGLSGETREASSRIFPKIAALKGWAAKEGKLASVEGISKIWSEMGLPGKGAAIGLIAMLPFIPGMIGSRKTGAELRDVYSGAEPVPIRSGRWWEMGVTPFEGGRIKEWRPHWSLLHKSHARDVSIYGSEEEKWAHNPILHPFKYLSDPYWLEKKNLDTRPYPVTSPAFSNVPLIGPLLAATIGRLVKPEVRMHEGEWNEDSYNLYSPGLEPKSFKTDSFLEKNLLEQMARQGIALGTQESVGKYRVDFAIHDGDRKIAIEADGVTYHKNKKADAERQKDIEKKGWKVLRVSSTDFFDNPEKSATNLTAQLKKLGISPTQETGLDVKSGLQGLAPVKPESEYSISNVFQTEAKIFSEYTGLIGFINRSIFKAIFPGDGKAKPVHLQGSRQVDSLSRAYYERELGAGMGPGLSEESFGYTEPIRRFIQPETETQLNEIPNEGMPSWLPGKNGYIDFHRGDPFNKISEGYARLPGPGYSALHPELKGFDPEDYPDITKLSILSDVAPYSKEYQSIKQRVGSQSQDNTELKIEYEKILQRVKQTKESVIPMDDRHFTGETEELKGTIASAGPGGITLTEYPNQRFQFSSVGLSAADAGAKVIGESNNLTRSAVATEVDKRREKLLNWFGDQDLIGSSAKVIIPKGASEHSEVSRAVIIAHGKNINRELLDEDLGNYRKDLGGAESGEVFGSLGNFLGSLAEGLSFQGDASRDNVMRYLPSPAHTKLWQERTPLAQYINNEVIGTNQRRWDRPVHDFLMPYFRGAVKSLTDKDIIPQEVKDRKDLNTLSDTLTYLRAVSKRGEPGYTSQVQRTSMGADQFKSPIFLATTLPGKESHYFNEFIKETDENKRETILEIVSPEMKRTLETQWTAADTRIKGGDVGSLGEGGRLYTKEDLKDYEKSGSGLDYGNYVRSKEIADFFSRTGFTLPEEGSQLYASNIDYEDIKLKVIEQEGYDAHDFGIFEDRSNLLWRKPYLGGAIRELTSGDTKSSEELRKAVEQLMMNSGNYNPNVRTNVHTSPVDNTSVLANIDTNHTDEIEKDVRRNPEKYKNKD
jgi:very-short-patch-repair endonuclease